MYRYRDDFSSDLGGGLVGFAFVAMVISAFLIVAATVFVVRTFVRYPQERIKLWIALAVCVVSCVAALVLYKLTEFEGSPALAGIGIAVLLITCMVIDLKNRDTLLRENVNLIDEVLHKPWWGSEDTPLQEQEREPVAA